MFQSNFRYLIFVIFVIFVFTVFNAHSQRGEIPQENPENALDLKVVFQEYESVTTNQYGHTLRREENEYLNLKVNGMGCTWKMVPQESHHHTLNSICQIAPKHLT